MAGKVNPMQGYQEATNQLLAINEQRKSNNAQAKMEETLQAAQNNTLAQASEFVATQSPQATYQPANLNPATQNILGQYGLGQPKIQKTSSSSQVTKQNITINNKNTTITNNNVSVPANSGGPIQGRPIQFQDPGQIKFKTWLSNSFAQQNEQAAKRQRDYEKRDSALVRNSNKLMKKLEETGKSIATSLNPKNMASSMGNQLKTLLFVFGFAKLAKEWPNLMTWVDKISKKVSNIASDVKGFFSPDGGLSKMLGGKNGEGPLTALKNLFFDKNDGIFAYIRTWLSARMGERREAIKTLTKPNMSWNVGDGVGNNITRILGNVVGYLGDILSAIIDPTSAARNTVKATAEQAESEYQNNNQKTLRENRANVVITDENGRSKGVATSAGDQAIVEGRYQGVKPGSVDNQGNLTNNPISSIAQGNELMRVIDDSRRTGNLQTATVATGFARLHNAAQENGKVVLTEEFLSHYLGQDGIRELGLQKGNYRYIVRPKTHEEMAMDLLSISRENEDLRKWLTGIGMFTGGVVSGPGGVIFGGLGGNGLGKLIEEYKKRGLPETVVELRPAGAEADYSKGERYVEGQNPQNLYEITSEQLQSIIDKITGKENINVDLNSTDFMRAIESSLITQDTPLRVNRDIDIDQTYRVNDMVERNNAQLQTLRENSRANTAVNNTMDMGRGLMNDISNRVSGISLFSNRQSATYNRGERGDVAWSDIRINKKDDKQAHAGTGAIGKENINREYLTNLLNREISGEFGRREGRPDQCYVNPLDGGAQAGHGNYGYGNTYNTLKNLYQGPVSFKMPDGTVHTEPNLDAADKWFVAYWKANAPGNKMPANKRVYLTSQSAEAINKASFKHFIDGALKMDHEIMGAMDEQTLGGLLHIAYGGMGRYNKLIDFYKNNKEEALADLQSNNGVHTEDFINRVMMNTSDGLYAMQTDNANGTHFDRRGYLSGYQAFNVYSADEWNQHLDLAQSNRSVQPTASPSDQQALNIGGVTLPEVSVTASAINNTAQASFTPGSSLSDNYPNAFSGNSGGNDSFTSVSSENPNYTSSLNSMGTDVKTMLSILRIMGQTDAQTLEATNNVVSAVGSLRSSGTAYTPSSPSFTDGHYNQSPIS